MLIVFIILVFIIILILISIFFVSSFFYINYKKKNYEKLYHTHNYISSQQKIYSINNDFCDIDKNKKCSNLTWEESYHYLLEKSNDSDFLKKYITKKNIINEDINLSLKLARFEILHQAEELLLKTGYVIPIFNGNKNYYSYIENDGFFIDKDGMFHFEKLKKNKNKKQYHIVLGPRPRSLDPTIIINQTQKIILNNLLIGPKFFNENGLSNGLCEVEKEFINNKTIFKFYIGGKKDINNGKGNVFWEDKAEITSDDFIWSLNLIAANNFNNFLLNDVVGYSEFRENEKNRIKNSLDSLEENKTFSFYNGMKGIKKISKYFFKIEVNGFQEHFEKKINFVIGPFPRHKMVDNLGQNNEMIFSGWWSQIYKKDPKHFFCASGPFKIKDIDWSLNGYILLEKNYNYLYSNEIDDIELKFSFYQSEMLAENDFFYYNLIDFNYCYDDKNIKYFSNKKKNIFFINEKPNSFINNYIVFNSNDDTFDFIVKPEDTIEIAENKKAILRKIISLIIDRNMFDRNNIRNIPTQSIFSDIYEDYIPIRENNKIIAKKCESNCFWSKRSTPLLELYSDVKRELDGRLNNFNEEKYFKQENYLRNSNILIEKLAKSINLDYFKEGDNIKFKYFPEIKITVSSRHTILNDIMERLKLFNINVRVYNSDRNEIIGKLINGEFSMNIFNFSLNYNDPKTFLEVFSSFESNSILLQNLTQLNKKKAKINRSFSNLKK